MNKIIIANWKMNPASSEEAEKLARDTDISGLIIAPPFSFFGAVSRVLKNAELGVQNLSSEPRGTFEGEVLASELASLGVRYAIIGHSDRRKLGETDEMVAKKIKAAVEAGPTPILCVGESAEERASGATEAVIERELRIGLSELKNLKTLKLKNLIVAYEPIWAIGTGTPDTPENMLNMVQYIKRVIKNLYPELVEGLRFKIIYGGSVTSANASGLLQHREIEGVLVGGASLKPAEIIKIVEIAKKY